MQKIWQGLCYSIRVLSKKPVFTLTIIATLAIAIGANTTIFSFVSAILLNPLPYPNADRLVLIESVMGNQTGRVSTKEISDLKEQEDVFESIATYMADGQYNASGEGKPEELPATLCTGNLFETLGVKPLHGSVWPANYDKERSFGVVLSYELWQRRFGAKLDVIGQKITLDGAPFYTIFGVLPPNFNFPNKAQLFRSICITPTFPNPNDRKSRDVLAIARLKAGISYKEAQARLLAFGERLSRDFPDTNAQISFKLVPLKEFYVGNIRAYLIFLFAAVIFVQLIACVNVINLMLTQAIARDKEFVIRTALGASHKDLLQQLLLESLSLSFTGGFIGLILSFWWIKFLQNWISVDLPLWIKVYIDWRVLLFTFAISIVTGVLSGILPIIKAWQVNLSDSLKEATRSASGSQQKQHLRHLFVIVEFALALVLLVGAGLMIKSLVQLQKVELGFNPENMLTFRVALPWKTYPNEKIVPFHQQALEKLAAIPGVTEVSFNSNPPLCRVDDAEKEIVILEGQSVEEQQRNPYVNTQQVSPNYFTTLGITLIKGRFFTNDDRGYLIFNESSKTYSSEPNTENIPQAAIVSQRLAEQFWPGQDPIGKRLKFGDSSSASRWRTVVGVVSNVKRNQVTGQEGLDIYLCYLQTPPANVFFLLRSKVNPMSLAEATTQTIWSIDKNQSTFDYATMEKRISDLIW
jgi:putative ABC transport system permease protein